MRCTMHHRWRDTRGARIFPIERNTQNAITLTLALSAETEPNYNVRVQCEFSAFESAVIRIYIYQN